MDLLHKPSGIRIFCTEERSQLKNKVRAMQILRAKLFEMKMEEQQAEISSRRKLQVGSGSRSEKIRTYNYKDNRVSDHRQVPFAHPPCNKLNDAHAFIHRSARRAPPPFEIIVH